MAELRPSEPAAPGGAAGQVAGSGEDSRATRIANGIVFGIARHWLAIFNSAWALYVLLPFLAPVFVNLGWYTPARAIYGIYSFLCHQLPDHSYFLFGPKAAPLLPALTAAGMPPELGPFQQRQFIGNEFVGYKVAICQRDVAIYGSVLLAGLLYGLVRKWLRPIPVWVFLVLLLPMAIDGGTQLIGLRESNWWLRTLTGGLFGAGAVWLAYPYLEEAMADVIETERLRQAQQGRL